MTKRFFLISCLSFALLFAAGCGGGDSSTKQNTPAVSSETKAEAPKNTQSSAPKKANDSYEDYFTNPETAEKLQVQLKERLKGNKVVGILGIYSGGRLEFQAQDASKPENLDAYTFRDGKWKDPSPVVVKLNSGKTDKESLAAAIGQDAWSVDSIDFKVIPKIHADALAFAEKEGMEKVEISDVYQIDGKKQWIRVSIKSSRRSGTYFANLDGSFMKFN